MGLLVKIERTIVFTCSLFLASVFFAVVLMRYVFETDLFAYEEWALVIAFLMYFAGGALASKTDSHIKADLISEIIKSEEAKRIYTGILQLVEAAILIGLSYFAIKMFLHEFARWPNIPTSTVYKIPLAVPRFFITAGFILMAFHALVNGIQILRGHSVEEETAL
ncbi:TRAP transporter small permease [Ruegeria sp. ANG-R]|uniref:TRAP transporter small permease n=1 Tax=Ruegeria sp. ANG-R TaxID=1577903 RepID=UPI000689B1C2|nr:TRAP transporter small permease [Ruegeria sp. ANG-R]